MNLFKRIFPGGSRAQEIEFLLLAGFALLFPDKQSYLYFLGFGFLLTVMVLRRIVSAKNIALTRFSLFLALLNALFAFAALFSPHPYKSVLFAADLLLVSCWFFFSYLERENVERCLRLAAMAVSVSSLVVLVFFALNGGVGPASQIYRNPILQGIVSALAALLFLHNLLQKYSHAEAVLLALNAAAVVVSASKAAFLGAIVFAAAMIVGRKPKWLFPLGAFILLLAATPNPIRRMIVHSLRDDPYVFDRISIWSMSARMHRAHPWTGVGPDLFDEAAPRFNFAQEKGPSRYGKVPESPHSDYWKVIVENGLPGLLLVLLFLFLAIRRLLSPPLFDLPKVLLAFLMTQMLFINCVFNFFFLLIFLLLLYAFLTARPKFASLTPAFRLVFSSFVLFVFVVWYLFPYAADRSLDAASKEKNVARRFDLLKRAALFSPMDERAPLAKAELLLSFSASRNDLEAWTAALKNARLAQRLNGYDTSAHLLESALFADFRARGVAYPALADEILNPLREAERNDPFKPFLKLHQAAVLRESGRTREARERARAALELEPDYAAAIAFIHELDGLPADDPVFRERLARIREKAERLRARPGSYLFELHRLPAGK